MIHGVGTTGLQCRSWYGMVRSGRSAHTYTTQASRTGAQTKGTLIHCSSAALLARPDQTIHRGRRPRPQLTYIVLLQHLACVHGSSSTQLHVHALCAPCGAPRHETTTTGKPQPALHSSCTAAVSVCSSGSRADSKHILMRPRGPGGLRPPKNSTRAHSMGDGAMEVTGRRQCRTANAIVEQRTKKKKKKTTRMCHRQ